jgi:choline-sulfatase
MAFQAMTDEDALRRIAACYYALVTHLDREMATVLRAAESLGLLADTRVVYTSDHGEALGAHGLFGKYTLLDPSAAIPLVMCGPGVPSGRVVDAPVSHVDLYPTLVESAGLPPDPAERELLGASLLGDAALRGPVFAEYHAAGSRRGAFMLRDGRHKLIYHVDAPRQLFDLAADPDESRDLAATAAGGAIADRLEARLRMICDPQAVDARARADQRAKAEYWGGNDAIRKEGLLVYTPPPGVAAVVEPARS